MAKLTATSRRILPWQMGTSILESDGAKGQGDIAGGCLTATYLADPLSSSVPSIFPDFIAIQSLTAFSTDASVSKTYMICVFCGSYRLGPSSL